MNFQNSEALDEILDRDLTSSKIDFLYVDVHRKHFFLLTYSLENQLTQKNKKINILNRKK